MVCKRIGEHSLAKAKLGVIIEELTLGKSMDTRKPFFLDFVNFPLMQSIKVYMLLKSRGDDNFST